MRPMRFVHRPARSRSSAPTFLPRPRAIEAVRADLVGFSSLLSFYLPEALIAVLTSCPSSYLRRSAWCYRLPKPLGRRRFQRWCGWRDAGQAHQAVVVILREVATAPHVDDLAAQRLCDLGVGEPVVNSVSCALRSGDVVRPVDALIADGSKDVVHAGNGSPDQSSVSA